MIIEVIRFVFYSGIIVLISKYVLTNVLRKLAEALKLKAKTVGNIAGITTSIPEFLTITISSIMGFPGAGLYNILSSSIINLIQYFGTICFNKNIYKLNNGAVKVGMILVILTIIIPLFFIGFNLEVNGFIVFLFICLYILFLMLNWSASKLYLKEEKDDTRYNLLIKNKKFKIMLYIFILLLSGVALFFISNGLGNSIRELCVLFSVPEATIGILLGFITSIPELITFFEAQKYYKMEKNEMSGVVEATNNLLTSNCMNLFVIQVISVIITGRI